MKRIPAMYLHAGTCGTAALIIILSLLPHPPEVLNSFTFSDKIFHALAYTAFSLFLFFSLGLSGRTRRRGSFFAFLFVLVLGGSIELIQPYFSRSKDFYDFLADTAGGAAGIVLSGQFIRIFHITFGKKGVLLGKKTER